MCHVTAISARKPLAPFHYSARPSLERAIAVYLIDRKGFERTGYLFPFLPSFVALDLKTLGAKAA
jgi:hypothetical protein